MRNTPAPKSPDGKPDLSGIWMRRGNYLYDLPKDGVQVPFQPWAEALYKQRKDNLSNGAPGERCLPRGVPAEMMTPNPFKVVQTPGLVMLVFEQFSLLPPDSDGRPCIAMKSSASLTFTRLRWRYSAALNDVAVTRGRTTQPEYNRLLSLSEKAWMATEASRLAVERHTENHGC